MAAAFECRTGKSGGSLIEELHSGWSAIYRTLMLHQGLSSEPLKFAAMLKAGRSTSNVLGEEDSLQALVELSATGKTTPWESARRCSRLHLKRDKVE
jgi:hypothetical protein